MTPGDLSTYPDPLLMELLFSTASGFLASRLGRRVRLWLLDWLEPERKQRRQRVTAYLCRRNGRRVA